MDDLSLPRLLRRPVLLLPLERKNRCHRRSDVANHVHVVCRHVVIASYEHRFRVKREDRSQNLWVFEPGKAQALPGFGGSPTVEKLPGELVTQALVYDEPAERENLPI